MSPEENGKYFDELEHHFKELELDGGVVRPWQSYLVRSDGWKAGQYTEQYPFNKPYDARFMDGMMLVGGVILFRFNASIVYVCSDEATWVFPAVCTREQYDADPCRYNHFFGGRATKICTLIASTAGALFSDYFYTFRDSEVCLLWCV